MMGTCDNGLCMGWGQLHRQRDRRRSREQLGSEECRVKRNDSRIVEEHWNENKT